MNFLAGLTNYLTYAVVGFSTLAIVVGVSTDISFYSNGFMADDEIKMVYRPDGSSQRHVASRVEGAMTFEYEPLDKYGRNYRFYSGLWIVRSFVGKSEEVMDKYTVVDIELIGTSLVRVKQMKQHIDRDIFAGSPFVDYNLSETESDNAIVLSKFSKDGVEEMRLHRVKPIVEMKVVADAQKVVARNAVESTTHKSADGDEYQNDVSYKSISLEINNVYHPQKSTTLLQRDKVSGGVDIKLEVIESENGQERVNVKEISNLAVEIEYNDGKCPIEIGFAEVRDGGSFVTDITDCKTKEFVEAGGIITRNGQDSYQIVLQGPYQGASLRFSDAETLQKTQEESDAREKNAEVKGFNFDDETPAQQNNDVVAQNENQDWQNEGTYSEGDTPEIVDTEAVAQEQEEASNERMTNGV